MVLIFKGKGDISNCSCHRVERMKVVERVLEKRLHKIVTIGEMQSGFMPERNN